MICPKANITQPFISSAKLGDHSARSEKKSLLNKEQRTIMDVETQYCFRAEGGGRHGQGEKVRIPQLRKEGPRSR